MTAQPKLNLPSSLRNEMARLVRSGLIILPLGGNDGKSPLLRNWAASPPPLGQSFAVMSRTGSLAFGIRLDGLVVLDFDTQDLELVAQIEARFGTASVQVQTPRGFHLYYAAGDYLPALRAEGLPIDVKSGPHAYAVAPPSVRPDGGLYAYAKGDLSVSRLRPLRASAGLSAAPVAVGERHTRLVREALAMVELVDGLDELFGNLTAFRDDYLPDPGSVPDSEVRGIAKWTWTARLENRLYSGRNSVVKVSRKSIDALRGNADALALYTVLLDAHGHVPGKRFTLDGRAMRAAGLIDLSRQRFLAARKAIEEACLLSIADQYCAGSRARTYCLSRLPVSAENITALRLSPLPERSGGRASLTYVDGIRSDKSRAAE